MVFLVGLILVQCAAGAVGAKTGDPGPQNAKRVDEIAAMLPEHPLVEGAVADDRVRWGALAATDEGKRLVADAAKRIEEGPVTLSDDDYTDINRSGNRTRYERQYNQHGNNFETFVLAECLEGRGRFLLSVTNYLEAILSERSWVLPAHDRRLDVFHGRKCYVDLASCERALMLAIAVRWLGDRLPAGLTARVRHEVQRRVFDPFLASARDPAHLDRDHWWYRGALNWNSVCHSSTVRAALMLLDDRRTRAEFVESAERGVRVALGGYTDDGYCPEGMGYWNYGWGWQLRLAVVVLENTGGRVNLCADPKCRLVMAYASGNQLVHGSVPNYADGGGGRPSALALALGKRLWPDMVLPGADAVTPLGGGLGDVALTAFVRRPAVERLVLPPYTWFDVAQVYLGRAETPKKPAFAFSVKGGNNGDSRHSHNDVGSWCLFLGDVNAGGDPIPSIYTGNTFGPGRYDNPVIGSYGHPVPLVAGRTQSAGAKFAAKVLRTDFGKDRDTVVFDMTAAYEVPELVSLVREVTFDRVARSAEVRDRVRFSSPCAFEVPVVTYQDVRATYEKGHFTLVVPRKGDIDLQLSAPTGGDWRIKSELLFNPLRSSAKRLALSFDKPVAEAEVVATFSSK